MALVYILIALSLLSGIPPDTSAFKYGEFASFNASVLITPGWPDRKATWLAGTRKPIIFLDSTEHKSFDSWRIPAEIFDFCTKLIKKIRNDGRHFSTKEHWFFGGKN